MVATAANWGAGVALVLVPVALQAIRHTSVLQTGALFLSFSIAYHDHRRGLGSLVHALGGDRAMDLGLFGFAAGLALLTIVGVDAPVAGLLIALAIAGAGNGLVYKASTSVRDGRRRAHRRGRGVGPAHDAPVARADSRSRPVDVARPLGQESRAVRHRASASALALGAALSVLAVVALRVGPLRVPRPSVQQ